MRLTVISIKDLATGAFMQPTFHHHPAHAIRSFSDEVNREDENNILNRHPGDFELWKVAEWDDQLGAFIPAVSGDVERLVRAVDIAKRD